MLNREAEHSMVGSFIHSGTGGTSSAGYVSVNEFRDLHGGDLLTIGDSERLRIFHGGRTPDNRLR